MGEKSKISLRHIQVDKANSVMVIVIAAAAACAVFSLVACTTLWKQAGYNKKVITAKEKTVKQVNSDIASLDQLKTSYEAFVAEKNNIIGGTSDGPGDKDGDNARITLDAMPSVYDFPGMVTGFTKMLSGHGYTTDGITGTDEEIAQQSNQNASTIVEIPLTVGAKGSVDAVQEFLTTLDRSVRPINVQSLSFNGESTGTLQASATFKAYYQPKKKFEVKTEVVK